MSQGVPDEVKRQLSAALTRTVAFSDRLGALGTPDFVAMDSWQESEDARNRAPQAHATMEHVALVVQVARYHIHLASFERVRHRDYLEVPNESGGNIAAAFLFTSFANHAIAAEHHLTLAFSLRFGYMNHDGSQALGKISDVRRRLTEDGHQDLADILKPFQEDAKWAWLKKYRNRWDHRDPMRIAEYGMQFSNRRDYWKEKPTTLSGGRPGRAIQLDITAGDPPETSVNEMLDKGTYCFNLLAKQVDSYITILEGMHQNPGAIQF
jgi:hypothetical protein